MFIELMFLPCRKFFGSNGQAPKRQTTISFSRQNGNEPVEVGARAADDVRNVTENEADVGAMKVDGDSPRGSKPTKRDMASEDEDGSARDTTDAQPSPKRQRKSVELDATAKQKTSPPPRKSSRQQTSQQQNQNGYQQTKGKAQREAKIEKHGVDMEVEDVDKESSEPASEEEEEEEEEKPEVKKKNIEKVQTILKSSGNHPYPDWKAGEPVPYAALCQTFSLIEMNTKRLIKLEHCSLFLRQVLRLTPADVLPTVQLMINKLAADYAGIELGIGESLIMKAIGESTGRTLNVIKTDQHEIGDLGLVAAKSRSNQPTMFKPKPLTVRGVHEGLLGIAKVQGHGAQDKKISGIKKLLSAADTAVAGKGSKGVDITKDMGGPSESKFIVRFLEGKPRLGLAEKTVLVALAQAVVTHEAALKGKTPSADKLAEGESILKSVYSELPSYEVVIPAMLEHGIFKLGDVCKLQPSVPLKPMLARPTKSVTEVLDRFEGKEFTCEYKYDGERSQIHYVAPEDIHKYPSATTTLQKDGKGLSAIFSRNSEDLSKKYPDILDKVESWKNDDVKSFVVDGETVAWDVVNKKVLPFQMLQTRKRKDVKTENVKVKVCVFAFDLLFLNGEVSIGNTLLICKLVNLD